MKKIILLVTTFLMVGVFTGCDPDDPEVRERIKQDPHLQEKIKKEYPEVIEEIEKEENKEVEEPEEITLDEYISEEIEYARVWLQVVENEDPNVLYVQHIPKGTHINEYEHEESVTYPEDVIMIFTDYTAGGMVVYSGNGDGTINLYDVPSHWQGGSTTLDNEDIKEYTNKIINETETIYIEPRSDKKIEQLIKVLEYAG